MLDDLTTKCCIGTMLMPSRLSTLDSRVNIAIEKKPKQKEKNETNLPSLSSGVKEIRQQAFFCS